MYLISQEEFINLFENKKNEILLFSEFFKKASVRIKNKLIPLKEYAENHKIPRETLSILFDIILHRNDYLTKFYKVSMTPTKNLNFPEPMKSNELSNNKNVNYKNIIRNIHYKEILKETESGLGNTPSFLNVLEDLYLNHIIDYKILTPSALHYMKNGRLGSVFSSFYFRASILNPYLVYSLNMSELKGKRIFTPTLGWSSYSYGFLECPYVTEYVGTDVIDSVCKKTDIFIKKYYPNKISKIYKCPSEDLLKNTNFKKKYNSHFDVVFFSPPYYRIELYPGKDQSTTRYDTYEKWLSGYWEKTIELCNYVLENKGKLCYIVSGYGNENNFLDLVKDMNNITEKHGFRHDKTLQLFNKNSNMTGKSHRDTNEKIIIFKKI